MNDGSTDSKHVLILGATGHIGAMIAEACQARVDLVATGASSREREGMLHFDINAPEHLERLGPFDMVINVADSYKAWPLEVARYCLTQGKVFMETSADLALFRALMALPSEGCPGTIILGGGAFPGLSTQLLDAAGSAKSLEFRATWSVLSGSGAGTVEVMLRGLHEPAVIIEGGQEVSLPAMSRIEPRRIGGKACTAYPLSMPDTLIAAAHSSAKEVAFWASIKPALPRFMVSFVGWLAKKGVMGKGWVRALLGGWLNFLRGWLFRKRATALRIELHGPEGQLAAFSCPEAFKTAAQATAFVAARWPQDIRGIVPPGAGVSIAMLREELGSQIRFEP